MATQPIQPNAAALNVPLPDAVAAARAEIGVPYSWGGGHPSGPSLGTNQGAHTVGFDCSSLVQYAYAKAGINIGRTTYDQWAQGRPVDMNNLQPGDAIYFDPGSQGPDHVALYIGSGQVIEAPHTGEQVKITPLAAMGTPMGARTFGDGSSHAAAYVAAKATGSPAVPSSPATTGADPSAPVNAPTAPPSTAAPTPQVPGNMYQPHTINHAMVSGLLGLPVGGLGNGPGSPGGGMSGLVSSLLRA